MTSRRSGKPQTFSRSTSASAPVRGGGVFLSGFQMASMCRALGRQPSSHPNSRHFVRADAGTRTPDPFITSEVLYQLSYVGVCRAFAILPGLGVGSGPSRGRRLAGCRCPEGISGRRPLASHWPGHPRSAWTPTFIVWR
jgi:hypothetical protein